MPPTTIVKPLGEVLLNTGLVSAQQVNEALQDQHENSTQRLGEILAQKGCIKQETADFFAEQWPRYIQQPLKLPIGQYLREAALLDSQQVMSILEEQTQCGDYFGELIIKKGWLGQQTINFFLDAAVECQTQTSDTEFEEDISPEHKHLTLSDVQTHITENQQCNPYLLLLTYQKALLNVLPYDADNLAQSELLKLGLLVKKDQDSLAPNTHYQDKFGTGWVDDLLGEIRPFEKVRINLFKLEERASLPFVAIEEVFSWTGREPVLTQIVCQAIYDEANFISADQEKEKISRIVKTHVLDSWRSNAASQHLNEIVNQLHAYPDPFALLTQYQQILRKRALAVDNDPEQIALKKLGLIAQEQNNLHVVNRIYESVFNEAWVSEEIAKQVPSATSTSKLSGKKAPAVSLLSPSKKPKSIVTTQTSQRRTKFKVGRILIGLLVLGCLGALAAILAKRVVRRQIATQHFDQGNLLFSQGKHEDAINQYNEVLAVDGNYHQAWTNRGYALAGTNDYAQMLSSCRSATIIAPDAVYAWNCQGEALHNLKQFEDAIAAYDKAIQLDPEDPVFWINKGESMMQLGQYDESLDASQKAIDRLDQVSAQSPSTGNKKQELAIAWNMRARVFQKTKQDSEALKAFDKSLSYNPEYFSAQLGKGITFKDLGQHEAANKQFMLAKEQGTTKKQQAEAWFYAGLTHCNLGQIEDALDAYDNALNLNPNFEAAQTAKDNYCF